MRKIVSFRVRQTSAGWTYDLWSVDTGWLNGCGDNAPEAEANYNAPRDAGIFESELNRHPDDYSPVFN